MLHRNDSRTPYHRKLYTVQTILPLHYSNLSPLWQIVGTIVVAAVVVLAFVVVALIVVAAAAVVATDAVVFVVVVVAAVADGFDEIVDALEERIIKQTGWISMELLIIIRNVVHEFQDYWLKSI